MLKCCEAGVGKIVDSRIDSGIVCSGWYDVDLGELQSVKLSIHLRVT